MDEQTAKKEGFTSDELMGLVMSTESNGLEEERLEVAVQDWTKYYTDNEHVDFGWCLCHLITKGDLEQLHRISKGFPEHIRVYAEKLIIDSVPQERVEEIMAIPEEELDPANVTGEINE